MTNCPVSTLSEETDTFVQKFLNQNQHAIIGGVKSQMIGEDSVLSDLHEFIRPKEVLLIEKEMKQVLKQFDEQHYPSEKKLRYDIEIDESNIKSKWKFYGCRQWPWFQDFKTKPFDRSSSNKEKYNYRNCYKWLFKADGFWEDANKKYNWEAVSAKTIFFKFGLEKVGDNWHQTIELRPWQHYQAPKRYDWPILYYEEPLSYSTNILTRQIIKNPEIRRTDVVLDDKVIAFSDIADKIKEDLGFIRNRPTGVEDLKRKILARFDGRNAQVESQINTALMVAEVLFAFQGVYAGKFALKQALGRFRYVAKMYASKGALVAYRKAAMHPKVRGAIYRLIMEFVGLGTGIGFFMGLDKYTDHLSEECQLNPVLAAAVKTYDAMSDALLAAGLVSVVKAIGRGSYKLFKNQRFKSNYLKIERFLLELDLSNQLVNSPELKKKLKINPEKRLKLIKSLLKKDGRLLEAFFQSIAKIQDSNAVALSQLIPEKPRQLSKSEKREVDWILSDLRKKIRKEHVRFLEDFIKRFEPDISHYLKVKK